MPVLARDCPSVILSGSSLPSPGEKIPNRIIQAPEVKSDRNEAIHKYSLTDTRDSFVKISQKLSTPRLNLTETRDPLGKIDRN